MVQQKFCQNCSHKHNCQEIYRWLGKAETPSVVSKVVVAFLLPLMVFITSLAVFERILAKLVDSKELQTALGFLLALSVTFALMLIVKTLRKI